MASIVNQPLREYTIMDPGQYSGPTIYDETYGDHDETVISSRFHSDNGGVSSAVEDDLEDLRNAAQKTFSRRKPILDWKTTNHSFIDVHNDLRRLGVKNNTFFLKLYDRDLQGVDPFAPNLPLDMQIKVYLECVINPWYYLREIARVPAQGMPIEPGGGDRYQLDRNNLATWYLFINHIDSYASKPRQTGKTQDAIHKINYAYHFGSSSSSCLFFNKDLALSKENLARMKDQRDLYPTYLQMRVAFDEETGAIIKGTDNITTMKNPVTKNSVKVMPCATSKEAADRLGRGYTAPLMIFDEFDFQNFNVNIIMASVFAYSTASKNAIANDSCSARLFLSTPGDLSTRDGKAATDFIRGTKEQKGMFMWNDRLFDEPIERLKKEIYSTNYNGIVYVEHTWQQLKRSVEWYERQCNLCSYNQEVILREINLQRLAGSSMSPFSREQQLYLSSHIRKPKEEIDIHTDDTLSTIELYEKFDRRVPYIIGIDPAEGLSEDNNAMVIINPFTYNVAAEYKCPYISPKDFSKMVVSFMDRYCPHALLVVESNRGREFLQRISDSHYRSRIWYDRDRMNQLLSEKTDKYGGIPNSVLSRKVQGFVTGPKSRNLLFGCLESMVMEHIDAIFSKNLVNEMLTLIRKPNTGKIEAAPGEHDDTVMAYLIALYVYLNASNLEEFGISRRMRRPGEEVEKTVETEDMYRSRVKGALDSIPEEYRGIFEDFVRERNQVTDARQYAKELRKAEQAQRDFYIGRRSMGVDDDEIALDKFMGRDAREKAPEPTLGMQYYQMGRNLQGAQYRSPFDEDETILTGDIPDSFSEQDRASFEQGIFNMNHHSSDIDPYGNDDDDRYHFDPDDWVD